MEEAVGIDASKKSIELALAATLLGIKIAEDGIKFDDVKHLPEFATVAKGIYDFVASKPDLVGEMKDLDAAEIMELFSKGLDAYKQVKAALDPQPELV